MTQADTQATTSSGELGIDAENARPADLNVKVVDKAKNERTFECTISSPFLDELREPQPEEWELPQKASEIVDECMGEFEDPDSDGPNRLLSLAGAGLELWGVAPQGIGEALGLLEKAGKRVESIQITSEEGSIPWELMVPGDGDPRPLGVRYSFARWFIGTDPLRAAGRPAADARVAAPRADPPVEPLEQAEAEAKLVCRKLAGKLLQATDAVTIKKELEAWTGTVLHFVCHGDAGPPQVLHLDGKATLTPNRVVGMHATLEPTWRDSAPVVFLNACEAGRGVPTLMGAGGLTRSWTKIGAGAVIAPLWSVRDEIAHKVAADFYERITNEPTTPYAQIVRDIRAKAYSEEEDSYAAYCYFGSPWASAG